MARKLFKRKRSTPGTSTTRITRTDRGILATRFVISGTVAVAAAVLSYQALADLNARGGIAPQWRWVWPVIVDGPHLAGALAVVAAQRRRESTAWGWFLLLAATAASVAANVAASPPDTLSRVVHGAVPVVGVILVKDLCIGIRKHLDAVAAAEAAEAPAPEAAPARVEVRVPVVEEALPIPPKPTTPPKVRKPKPEPAVLRTVPPAAKGTKARAIDRYADLARQWIAEDPDITGSEIGRRLGKSERYGRNVLDAVHATA